MQRLGLLSLLLVAGMGSLMMGCSSDDSDSTRECGLEGCAGSAMSGGTTTTGGESATGGATTGGSGGATTGGSLTTGGNGAAGDTGTGGVEMVCPTDCTCEVFENRGYAFCLTPTDWETARSVCEAADLTLVAIESASEDAWVQERAAASGAADYPEVDELRGPWIGGSEVSDESWGWVSRTDVSLFWSGGAEDGGAVNNAYTHWAEGEPSGESYFGTEECLHQTPDGDWNDARCELERGYVCEG